MGLILRKVFRLNKTTSLNLSKTGVSVSKRFKFITVNSRGHVTLRIAPGISWRIK